VHAHVAAAFTAVQIGEGAGKEFQWWDHLYNKAANNIVVSNDVCSVGSIDSCLWLALSGPVGDFCVSLLRHQMVSL
jgi:hypothetical protein